MGMIFGGEAVTVKSIIGTVMIIGGIIILTIG